MTRPLATAEQVAANNEVRAKITKAYRAFVRKSGVDAAYDRERRTGDENREAFARLLDTPAATVRDMALKRQATLVQQGDEIEPSDSKKLIEALGRDFERLAGEAPRPA